MAYLGNQPSNNFVSLKRQVITGDGTTSYTLDHSVASVNDVAIFVNNVRQDPASYSISGTALTLGGTISSSDSCYVIFLGQALQTVVPDTNTITTAMIQNDAVTSAKVSGLGNYVIEKVDDYSYNTSVSNTAESSYIDIAGGNTVSFTPTSSSDIISLQGYVVGRSAEAAGMGIGIMRGTSSTISSSDTVVSVIGKHQFYPRGSGNSFNTMPININDTGLTAGTTYFYEIYGLANDASLTVIFQVSIAGGSNGHYLSGTHYKYIG